MDENDVENGDIETTIPCPVCGRNLFWDSYCSAELNDPDEEKENVKDGLPLHCKHCWADMTLPREEAEETFGEELNNPRDIGWYREGEEQADGTFSVRLAFHLFEITATPKEGMPLKLSVSQAGDGFLVRVMGKDIDEVFIQKFGDWIRPLIDAVVEGREIKEEETE